MLYSQVRFTILAAALTFTDAYSMATTPAPVVRQQRLPVRTPLIQLIENAVLDAPTVADEDCGCDSDTGSISMNGVSVSGSSLRSTVLADVNGDRQTVSSIVGEDGKAVIVFLRHLGWPLCWDYALNWQSQASRMSAAGVAGPLFISVGQPEQLAKFLEVNPELADAKALIDDSPTFEGYKSAGFNYLMGDKTLEKPPDFKPPTKLSMGKSFTFMKNAIPLAPIPKGEKMKLGDVPPGVKVLGGTYAIDGDAVRFSHMDEVPGATPEIEAVLASVGA